MQYSSQPRNALAPPFAVWLASHLTYIYIFFFSSFGPREQLNAREEQIEHLSRDLERERKLKTGDKALRNTEYLKHALLKWMVSNDKQQQQQLLPVIAEMLQFSSAEVDSVRDVLGRGFLRRVWG